ncbi:MAG: phage portal protein [Pseudomonadota bacterium]
MALTDRFRSLFTRQTALAPHRRSFDAVTAGRRGAAFRAFGSTGPETMAAAGPVRSRARYAAANNGWIANGVAAYVGEIVGAGIEPTSAHPDADLRPVIEGAFLDFAEGADAEGRTDLRGLLALMARATIIDGESFAVVEEGPEGIRVRVLPAEMVDESRTMNLPSGGYVAAGVEFDAEGRRVAYHVLPQRPTDLFATAKEPIRVPADEVLHLMCPLGPGQVRGISWLAPVLLTVNELDQLLDALLVGTKVAALHAGFITNQNDLTGPSSYDETGDEVSLEPGVIHRLSAGEAITFNSPEAAKDSVAFDRLTLGQIAAGLGVPQHLLDGDLSNANYSSLRAGLLPFRQRVEQFQYHCLVPQVLNPLWRRVISHEIIADRLDVDLAQASRAEWLPPRPMQVDPLKDTQALREQLALGLNSRTKAAAAMGWNVADLDQEIASDRERETALGLKFTPTGQKPDDYVS